LKILILGAQGFIGSNLVNYFVSKNSEVFGVDVIEGNAVKYNYQKVSVLSSDFETIFHHQTFDVCINASGSGNVGHSLTFPISDFEANAFAVAKVLDTIKKYQPACKYIHISSAAVYGNPVRLPVKETDVLAPLSPYGYHKMMSEIICREYNHLFDLPVAIIRPFSVFGTGLKKQLFWDICSKVKNSDNVTLYGTGNESRDFIHITDLMVLIEIIIHKSLFRCEIYNAASGSEKTIREIANIFELHYDHRKKITFGGVIKAGDPNNWKADITGINGLGFKPSADFYSSVIEYINWYNNFTDGV
jgi:UDP-glucose 4-epimerase